MKGKFPIDRFKTLNTPFYYYDMEVLHTTLSSVTEYAQAHDFDIHYAIKANANPKILKVIESYGLGADCVSGGEIQAALDAGFNPSKIVFAGVGKADWEIELGLNNDILCFNVESVPEINVIQEIAAKKGKIAQIALRLNPDVNANTHLYITTGLKENKFGINMHDLSDVIEHVSAQSNLKLIGLHFHIGSQITDLSAFEVLCAKVNTINGKLIAKGIILPNINMGGGLGIDYHHPNHHPIPAFREYFDLFAQHLKLEKGQQAHFEPGRSIVAQCGTLISKILYVKEGVNKKFAILDAGMTDLMRPALYQAYHRIENLTSETDPEKYDVVGPICESSDVFGKEVELNGAQRGDLIALRSAGAYGEIMASQYNCRRLPTSYLSEEL